MASKLSVKRQKLIQEIKKLIDIAEPIAQLKKEASYYTIEPSNDIASPYSGLPAKIDESGVTFYEVEREYSYGDDYNATHQNLVTWEDIDNWKDVQDRLLDEINNGKRAQAKSYEDNRRAQYEALKKEFGDK